ncbi:MAG: DsrE family protein [Bacteroidota bacterium]
MKGKIILFALISVLTLANLQTMAQEDLQSETSDKLVVLWTSDDPYVAERVAFMYTHAAKKNQWFEEVTLIVWGPSAKLIAENKKLQEKVKAMQEDGVEIQACIVCARSYNVADDLKALDFEVKGMGKPLTEYLKSTNAKVLTF